MAKIILCNISKRANEPVPFPLFKKPDTNVTLLSRGLYSTP